MTDTTMMSAQEAADHLEVNIETIRRAIRQRKLGAVKIGRGYRVSKAALEQYVKSLTIEVK